MPLHCNPALRAVSARPSSITCRGRSRQNQALCDRSGAFGVGTRAAAALLGLLATGCAHADDPGPNSPQGLVRARLVAETSTLQRGQTGWLAVHLTMKPGWHTY